LVRQRDQVRGPGFVRAAIERASVFCIVIPAASLDAGDIMGGAVLYDSEFLGAWFDQDANEGTDGTALIEKWDDASGSGSQTTISASLTVDAGAASLEWIAPLATGAELVAAGYKLNLKTTGVDASPAGRVTCWFKLVDDLGLDG
jgi:hypothetical protein